MKAGLYRKSKNFENGAQKEMNKKVAFGLNRSTQEIP